MHTNKAVHILKSTAQFFLCCFMYTMVRGLLAGYMTIDSEPIEVEYQELIKNILIGFFCIGGIVAFMDSMRVLYFGVYLKVSWKYVVPALFLFILLVEIFVIRELNCFL